MEHLRVRKPLLAPIQLVGNWIEEIHFVSDRTAASVAGEKLDAPRLDVMVSKPNVLANPDEPGQFLVRLRVKAAGPGSTIDATIAGLFLVPDDSGAAPSERLVRYNAPAILYGILRGVVAAATGASDAQRVQLPSVNLAELVDRS